MDERILLLLGLGVGALVLSQSSSSATAAPAPALAEPDPVDPSDIVDVQGSSDGLSGLRIPRGLGGLGDTYATQSRWFSMSQYVQIYIPFPIRSVRVGSNTYSTQFQYGGQWYTPPNLLRVWNPIRQLPSQYR